MTNGIPVTLARAVEEMGKYRHGLKVMSGGFTLSGGEALMQHRFAVKLLAAARGMGIHTALDTNGYYGERLSDAELEVADLVLLDLKGWDPERHRRLTGMEVGPTLEFARRLAVRKRPVWVRAWTSAAPATAKGGSSPTSTRTRRTRTASRVSTRRRSGEVPPSPGLLAQDGRAPVKKSAFIGEPGRGGSGRLIAGNFSAAAGVRRSRCVARFRASRR